MSEDNMKVGCLFHYGVVVRAKWGVVGQEVREYYRARLLIKPQALYLRKLRASS